MDSEVIQVLAAGFVASGVGAALWRVATAWLRAFERAANQKWVEHGDDQDGDLELKVQRVTDKLRADNPLMMSMVPRVVIERQVRKSKESAPPPAPD